MWNAIMATASSMLPQIFNIGEQRSINDRNIEMTQTQMDFQKGMSNTAHQREAQDLQSAGLNPILSATKGATTPAGSSPSLTAPQIVGPDILGALNLRESMENNKANRALTNAQAATTALDAQLKFQELKKARLTGGIYDSAKRGYDNLDKITPNAAKEKVKNNWNKMREWKTPLNSPLP